MNANYFSHDSNARNDSKLVSLRMKHGPAGYGVYFMLLERMREEPNYMSVKDYNMLAFDLRVDSGLIKSVVENFGLFVFTADGKYFYSESFLHRMTMREEVARKRVLAGRRGAENRWLKQQAENEPKAEPEKPKTPRQRNVAQAPSPVGGLSESLKAAGVAANDIVECRRLTEEWNKDSPGYAIVEKWLKKPGKHQIHEVIQHLQTLEQRGEIQPVMPRKPYVALEYLKGQLMRNEYQKLEETLDDPDIIDKLPAWADSIAKGKIKLPGKFILSQIS